MIYLSCRTFNIKSKRRGCMKETRMPPALAANSGNTLYGVGVIQLKQYGYNEQSSWRPQVVLNPGHYRTATPWWMLVCDTNPRKTKRTDNFDRVGGARMHLQHVHYIASHSIMMVIQNLSSLALKIQMHVSVAIQTKRWRVLTGHAQAHAHIAQAFETSP